MCRLDLTRPPRQPFASRLTVKRKGWRADEDVLQSRARQRAESRLTSRAELLTKSAQRVTGLKTDRIPPTRLRLCSFLFAETRR